MFKLMDKKIFTILCFLSGLFIAYCMFELMLYVPVNSYGHEERVSSSKHIFFLGKLDKAVNQYFVHKLSLVTDNNLS